MEENIRQLKEYMDSSKDTIVVTGSGISYMYGMRRLKQQTNRMDLMRKLTPSYVRKNPEEFYKMMKDSFLDATFELGPGPVHRQLAELEKKGLIQGIVTQNLDCLHELAGSTNVVEIVGSFADNICVDCGNRVHDVNIWNTGACPRCPKCGGPMMPENFDRDSSGYADYSREQMNIAADMIAKSELLIVIGTTGFRSEEYLARLTPATKIVQINPGSTMFDSMADLNIRMDAAKVFDEILAEE